MGAVIDKLAEISEAGKTKWDLYNERAKLLCDELVKSGEVVGYKSVNYVQGKMNTVYIFMREDSPISYERRDILYGQFIKLREECGISKYDTVYDNQMGEHFILEGEFEDFERRVRSWVDTV